MAKRRASAIPNHEWERHKEEIVSLYRESKLESVMQSMSQRYGFDASKNQYTGMLTKWGIRKNTSNNDWKKIYKCTRKRQSTGKPTNYFLYGKGISLKELEAKFGKYITFTENLYIAEDDDASMPDGFANLTPPAEATVLSLNDRAVKIDNLPWILFNKESQLQLLLWQSLSDSATFMAVDNSDMSSHQIYYQGLESLEACHAQQSLVPSSTYPGTFGFDNMSLNFECMFDPLPDLGSSYLNASLNSLPIDPLFSVSLGTILEKAAKGYWHTSLESIYKTYMVEDNRVENYSAMIPSAHSNPTVYQLFSLVIFMVTNNLLHTNSIRDIYVWANSNSCSWIFAEILKLKSTTIDVFATKLLPAAVHVGDCEMVRNLISRNVDIDTAIESPWSHVRTALSLAVGRRNMQMIKVLCDLGATPEILEVDSMADNAACIASLWSHQNIQILQLLLDHGADPECLVSDCQPGYPLVMAASEGNLEGVSLLLAAKANVNLSVLNQGGTALQAAAVRGHVQVAKALLKAKADANMVYKFDNKYDGRYAESALQTPIQLAARANNTEIAMLLLQSGAFVNFCPIIPAAGLQWIDAKFALHEKFSEITDEVLPFAFAIQYAAQNGNVPLVHHLLDAGAMLDSRIGVDQGSTPLQIAVRLGNVELVSLLLANNANVNAPPGKYNGRTAIQAAAENGNINIIELLLDAHAEVNAPPGCRRGRTALQAALQAGHINAARRLCLAGANINASPAFSKGMTALQAAVSFGNIDIVKELLSYGANVNAAAGHEKGLTALQAAVEHKNIDLLELLLQRGADVNALPSRFQNKTALQYAVHLKWMEGVQLLLDYNPDVRMLPPYDDSEAFSALGWAINNKDHDMIVPLLDHGAGPNDPIKNSQDAPPTAFLHALYLLDSYESIELFVKRGADIFQIWGVETALDLAIANRHMHVTVEVVKMIIGLISEATTGNHFDASFRRSVACLEITIELLADFELIRILLDAGADINAKDMDDNITILQKSVLYGTPEFVRLLLQHGAEVNVPATNWTGTPLQEAIEYEQPEIAELLLEHDVDVNALPAENRGVTALQAAAIRGYLPLARRLLEHGADVTAAPAPIYGRTAIDGAAEHGHLDMLQLLLNAYGDREGLAAVCNQAASFADKEGHAAIALWLRGYAAS